MEKIIGMVLDYENMQADKWVLKLTSGTYEGDGVIRTVEPATIKLNKSDYTDLQLEVFDLYYNPFNNQYNTVQRTDEFDNANYCPDYGYHLGGYMINGCNLRFMYPISDDVEYVRPFTDEFSDGYVDDSVIVDTNVTRPSAFSFDFNLDFQTTGTDIVPTSGLKEYEYSAFSSAFATI